MSDIYPDGFDPDDINEIEMMFSAISNKVYIYRVEFDIGVEDAAKLVYHWRKAIQGERSSVVFCLSELGKIIELLEEEIIDGPQ